MRKVESTLRRLKRRSWSPKSQAAKEHKERKNMQVTSLLSRKELAHEHDDDSCGGCGHEHAPVRWWQTLVGIVFVVNAFVVDWFFERGTLVASGSALIGSVIL